MGDVSKGTVRGLLVRRRYEFLLAALLQHLFIAVVVPDTAFYARWIWPINMVLLGVFSVGIFEERSGTHRAFKNLMNLVVVLFPTVPWFTTPAPWFMTMLSVCYVVFFLVIVVEVLRYLLRPSYIGIDLVSASICGYFLLLETSIFLMQALYYTVPDSMRGLDTRSFTTIYLDLVYYCSIVLTSIGLGDITPTHHITKLATAVLGVTGQMYSVVLVGILISKYTSASDAERRD